jgi:FkbM family methyltransferase
MVCTETDKSKLLEIAQRFGPIRVVYDCGSRDALDGIELTERTGAEELHVFECNPGSFKVCEDNVQKHLSNSSVKVYLNEIAISDRIGTIDFFPIDTAKTISPHEDGNPGASSLLLANGQYQAEKYVQDRLVVPTTTLAEYGRIHQTPDLLWMDLQGAELRALRGAGKMLDAVKVIHLEVGFRPMYHEQALFWDIDVFLRACSFERAYLDLGRWPQWTSLYRLLRTGPWVGNAVYVNPAMTSSFSV